MPPKKHEVQIIVEVPEQPPTLDGNPALVEKLLAVALTHPNDVAANVAGCLRMDDYLTNLQNGIVVDLWVETIIECAKIGFKANKTLASLELIEALRVSIVETQCDHDAKLMFKNFFIRHAGLSVKEKEQHALGLINSDGVLQEGGVQMVGPDGRAVPPLNNAFGPDGGVGGAGGGQGGAGSPAAGGNADTASPTSGNNKAKGKKKGFEEPPPPPKPAFDAGYYFLDSDDMKKIAPFILQGIIQHWQLYATVGAYSRTELFVPAASAISDAVLEPVMCTFTVGIQTPMPSHSLAMALTLEEHTKQYADETAKAAAERAALQAKEDALIASEKASLEAAAAKRRAEEEEEKAGMLYLKKATTARAVDQLTSSIETELSERQKRIILRIQKLEDALQLATSSPGM